LREFATNLGGLKRDWLWQGNFLSINHGYRMIQHLWMGVDNNKLE
jgi:hypothetical protein